MRTLFDITSAVRQGLPATESELRYAIAAYDVLIAQLNLPRNPKQFQLYSQVGHSDPRQWIGPNNDPAQEKAREWFDTMLKIGEENNENR